MRPKQLVVAVSAALLIASTVAARADEIEAGVMVCINDKWDEKEVEKGHKLVDYAGRCIHVPDDPAGLKFAEDCVGKYEYLPDQSWKGTGTCTDSRKSGDKTYGSWEEGSQLKEYTYKITGGTGKYKNATGDATYFYDNITDTLSAGRYKVKIVLP